MLEGCVTIAFSTATIFMALDPRVMVSSLDPAWSLTIYIASSTPYTFRIMSIVALVFVRSCSSTRAGPTGSSATASSADAKLEY